MHSLLNLFVSDNGPCFTSLEFAEFTRKNGIKYELLSPEGKLGMNKQAYDAHECFLLIIPEVILQKAKWFFWEFFAKYLNPALFGISFLQRLF